MSVMCIVIDIKVNRLFTTNFSMIIISIWYIQEKEKGLVNEED